MVKNGERLFTILWCRGPAWIVGKPVTEQKLDLHREYFADLTQRGLIVLAGPFSDTDSGGLAFLRAPDRAAAELIFLNDPAIQAGVFSGEIRPFYAAFSAINAEASTL